MDWLRPSLAASAARCAIAVATHTPYVRNVTVPSEAKEAAMAMDFNPGFIELRGRAVAY